jgi:hypothetical protein
VPSLKAGAMVVVGRLAVAVLALTVACHSRVSANEITTTLGISADAALPIAVYGATATYRRARVSAEVISSLGLRYGHISSAPTQFSFSGVSIRRLFGASSFVGIGETIGNRQSHYASVPPLFEDKTFTRVAGLRIEAGHDLRLGAYSSFELRANATPAMRGLYHNRYVSNPMICPANLSAAACAASYGSVQTPLIASQADVSATFVRSSHRGAIVAGLRYVNYVAKYDFRTPTYAGGALAEQDSGFLPFVGIRITL